MPHDALYQNFTNGSTALFSHSQMSGPGPKGPLVLNVGLDIIIIIIKKMIIILIIIIITTIEFVYLHNPDLDQCN